MAKSPLQRASRGRAAKALAENWAAKVGETWDTEEEALKAEFANLDLTEMEMADLHEAFRLRRLGSTNAEQIASRQLFAAVRQSLRAALARTLLHETGNDRMIRALAVFDRDEAATEQRIEVALLRPSTDWTLADLRRQLADLVATRADRRRHLASLVASDVLGDANVTSASGKSDAMRVLSRDGLETLYETGKINLRQRMAGRSYRRRWEAANRSLRSALAAQGGGAAAAQIAASHTRAALWEAERSRCDTAVQLRLRDKPGALSLMRRVAGEGASVSSVVGGGKRFDLAVKVLARALDVVADLLPYEDA